MRQVLCTLLALTFLFAIFPAFAQQDRDTVYFGVIPRYNPMVMYRSHQPLMDYLSETTPYKFELKLSRDYLQTVEMLKDGRVQIASLGDVTFAEACEAFDAMPILKPLNSRGEPFYRSAIVVGPNSSIHSLDDLRGRTFAFGDLHSTSGNLIPRDFLFRNGITLFDLGGFINLASHDEVARDVLKGRVDAGAVKDIVAEQYLAHGLKILALSEPIPSVPLVVRKDASPELIDAVSQALLAIDPNDPEWKAKTQDWNSEFSHGYVPAKEEDYEPIMALMDSIATGCGIRCH
jgi:phosphonate transport system substrate-binding protein